MAIAPINYATIQRTADIETFKNQQDTKPMVDQQNIQVGSVRKKTNKETKRTGGNPVGGSFDMKI